MRGACIAGLHKRAVKRAVCAALAGAEETSMLVVTKNAVYTVADEDDD